MLLRWAINLSLKLLIKERLSVLRYDYDSKSHEILLLSI